MYVNGNDKYYYITLMNENYFHPAKPKKLKNEDILKGAYKLKENKNINLRILASGVTLNFALEAEKVLKDYGINADIWSITSFNELYREGIEIERENRLNSTSKKSYVEICFSDEIPTIAVSEYQKAYPNQIREWINGEYKVLGTDGFGRSDTREELRNFFEISKEHIVLNSLLLHGKKKEAEKFIKDSGMVLNKEAPWKS